MADFRDVRCSTNAEPGANETRVAGHLLSMPPRPGGALAWGEPDAATNTAPVWTPDGLWFILDLTTFKEVQPDRAAAPEGACLAGLHAFADRSETVAKCYFVGGDVGRIKIGFSVDVTGRLRAIQSCSPIELRVLATASGGEAREAAYHYQFSDHRAHGEWFERHPDILAEIERLNAPLSSAFVRAAFGRPVQGGTPEHLGEMA